MEKKKKVWIKISTSMSVLDRLLNKPVKVSFPKERTFKVWELIVYKDADKKEYLWEYLWYSTKAEKKWTFVRSLAWREKENHEKNKQKAKDLFELFKVDFVKEFPKAKAITSRINLYGNQIYFYFHAEQRFDFADFVRRFREKCNIKFFIYQVWARDRIRLHPNLDEWYDSNGLPLMYQLFKHPLPQVDNEVVFQQGLNGRDMERLRDWSGKLDHTLAFEADHYAQEIPKYPEKWRPLRYDGKKMKCVWYNILTQEIKLRWEDADKSGVYTWEYITISLEEYEKQKTIKPTIKKKIIKKVKA